MARSINKKVIKETEEFTVHWKRFAELMSNAVIERNPTPENEKELILLSGELTQRAVNLSHSLDLEKSFVQKVVDFLEDIFNLRILVPMPDFQITLIREKWNTVQMDLNAIIGK